VTRSASTPVAQGMGLPPQMAACYIVKPVVEALGLLPTTSVHAKYCAGSAVAGHGICGYPCFHFCWTELMNGHLLGKQNLAIAHVAKGWHIHLFCF